MEWLNYHHLLYFWTVAREESVARAAEKLRLNQSTVSLQVHALERALGQKLFARSGRRLALTDVGRVALRYADEIFTTGQELLDVLRERPTGRPIRFVVGVASAVTKLVAFRLLQPALELPEPVRMVCVQDTAPELLARLAIHEVDLVIADAPVGPGTKVRAFNHLLGDSGVTFFAARGKAAPYRRAFPASLQDAPMLLPTEQVMMRRSIDQWFSSLDIRPQVVGEFDDAALLKVFGEAGQGVFPAPTVVERELRRQFRVDIVGRTEAARERYYALSVERRLRHPAVLAISETARTKLFLAPQPEPDGPARGSQRERKRA